MHLTDEQLNEYLDNESTERAQIESHLASCEDCAARLSTLENLFTEIESLPEITLSRPLAPHFTPHIPSLPRWLTLTATLQAAIAMIALILAAPLLIQGLPPYLSNLEALSFTEIFLEVQSQWMAWLKMLSQLQIPAVPEIPVIELSSMVIMLTLIGVSILWIVGNGLLLRNQNKTSR